MFSRFFIDRPIFATVLSAVIVIVGGVCLLRLPIAQYPDVTPPTIQVQANFPGANAQVVADTVAFPIEQEVIGVENMLYMSSQSTNDGQMTLDVTFRLGTNLDTAQVLVQNRVKIAEAKLPDEVKRQGVTTKKKSPSILLVVNLISPSNTFSQLYLSNFATINVKDELAGISGVGDVSFLGPRDYSMRVWLDPQKLAARNMTASEVVQAIRDQNVQVPAGRLGQPPTPSNPAQPFQLPLLALGRLTEEQEFEKIVVKAGADGQVVYLKDVVRDSKLDAKGQATDKGVELGAKNYDIKSYLDGQPAVTLAVYQTPGTNALDTAKKIRARMEELKTRFPAGVEYKIYYDTTIFIDESVHVVVDTLIEAFVLVFLVVVLFLQDWRATLLPMIEVPVSLVGTLAVMLLLGFSLNNLSLFGLVLAIGIVVDDAIVVIENVESWLAKGLPAREATIKAMEEVTGAVIAITLVLCSVFIPTAFIAGISGEFYRQFALTIAASTVISALNALTMTPARCAIMFKGSHGSHGHTKEALPWWGIAALAGLLVAWLFQSQLLRLLPAADAHNAWLPWAVRGLLFTIGAVVGWLVSRWVNRILNVFFAGFNASFDWVIARYGQLVGWLLRGSVIVLVVYGGLLFLTYLGFRTVPAGFIPDQDKGYLVVNAQLPDGASLDRTDELVAKLSKIALDTRGVAHIIAVPGYSVLSSTNVSNMGGMFVILKPFDERKADPAMSGPAIAAELRQKYGEIQSAQVVVFGAPPVDGLGNAAGFKMQVMDLSGAGPRALQGAVQNLAEQANQTEGLVDVFSSFSVDQPQLYIDIDRVKAQAQKVSLSAVHDTLAVFLGSAYVNDFTRFNRNWQVIVQADGRFRIRPEDIGKLEVRNAEGERVPLQTLIRVKAVSGPPVVNHYQGKPSAEINGDTKPGTSSGQAIADMDRLANSYLPSTMGYLWTELTFQQIEASKDLLTKLVFPLAVIFVFLVLAAKYESWSLPFSIILIVPMCLLSAIGGVWVMHMDNNIFTQIGLVVLVALAAKNAILIVEFAKQRQDEGLERNAATIEACRLRLRPILMTSLAFILGVVPLVISTGAGAEMRRALGVAVFSGMLGVTFFGILFTPVFYVVVRKFTERAAPAGDKVITNEKAAH
jgi:multidrug efflux pump